ncbi:MAG: sigma factor-like helix-turn-helix DNA-binding protein [Phycisphaerales bacterium]
MPSAPAPNPLTDPAPGAWAKLVESLGPASLLVVIQARMGPALRGRFTPDDVLQDVLLDAWNRRDSLRWQGTQAFRALLLTLIDHRLADAADHFAALKRGGGGIGHAGGATLNGRGARPGPGGAGPGGQGIATSTPSRAAVYREQAALMAAALEAVPEDCREVVRLRLFEELHAAQIAVRLGLGEAAVRHRFRRGVQAYKRAIDGLISSRARRTLGIAPAGGADSASGMPQPRR